MDNTNLENKTYFSPPEAEKKIKRNITMDKKDGVFALLFFASVFIFIDFAVMHGFNLGFTLSFYVMFAVFTAYLWKKNVKASAFSYLCGILSLAGAATFTLTRDVFVNFIMVFLVAALFTIYVFGISGSFRSKEGSVKMLAEILYGASVSPFSNLSDVTRAVGKSTSKNKNVLYALIGIVLAIPVLLVVVPLLVSADAAFSGLISMIGRNIGEYIGEALFALLLAPYVFSYAFIRKTKLDADNGEIAKAKKSLRFAPNAVSVSFLCVISVTYIIYLFSQFAYFFSAFSGILPEGYAYSASLYAREGFFEMFTISVINISIISAVNIFTKKENGRLSKALQAVECFISLFSVLILITAMSKMVLNIEVFGLSKYRLLVSLFMVMLAVIIAFFVLHIFLPKISYMQPIIIICSTLFIAFSFADMDNLVAMYNVNAYANERIETLDLEYMYYNLSDSAVPYMIAVANGSRDGVNEELAQEAEQYLFNKIQYGKDNELFLTKEGVMEVRSDTDFRAFNLTVRTANLMLADYFNALPEEEKLRFNELFGDDGADEEYEKAVDVYIEIESNEVYGIVLEYCVDQYRLGAVSASNAQNAYAYFKGDSCHLSMPESLFTYPYAPDNGIFGITVGVVLENGETVPIENLYEWQAEYNVFGESYWFKLYGNKEAGFTLVPEYFLPDITPWNELPPVFFSVP